MRQTFLSKYSSHNWLRKLFCSLNIEDVANDKIRSNGVVENHTLCSSQMEQEVTCLRGCLHQAATDCAMQNRSMFPV